MERLLILYKHVKIISIAKLCFVLFTLNGGEADFTIEPNDQRVKEGEQALFVCAPMTLPETQVVVWKQNDRIITNDEKSMDDEFTIRIDRNIHQYTLVISRTKRSFDNSQFMCCVVENEKDSVCSRKANLNINQVPANQYPECSPKTEVYKSPNEVTLKCISELTEPRVKLEWWSGSRRLTSRPAQEEQNQLVLRYTFKAKPEHDGQFLRCSLYSLELDIQRNCSVGPINVQFPPRVSIQAPNEVLVGREAVFICSAISKPRSKKFEWTLDRPSTDDEYRVESSGFVLRIYNPEKFNNTFIRCSVSNSEGKVTAHFLINVKKKTDTLLPTQNLTRKVVSTDNFSQSSNPDEMTIAMILAITGSCSFIIVLLMLIPLCMVRLFSQKVTMDASGRIIAQPDVYFEPKDTILTNEPTLHDTVTWRRNVGIQVPVDLECGSESMYAEVETEIYTKNLSNGSIYVAKSTHV